MLQTIRDRVQGWIATVIVGALAVAFALWGIQYYLERGGNTNSVAKVNGENITQQQWDAAYRRLRQMLQVENRTTQDLDQAAANRLKQQALQQLIAAQVLSDAAIKMHYMVNPQQLDAAIMQFPAFQENGRFSQERFQQVLNILSYSPEQFVADFARSLLVSQAQTGIMSSSLGLPNEADQVARLTSQKRDIGYALILATPLSSTIKIADTDINTYYENHQDTFKTPEKISIQYIELSADQLGKNIQVNDQEMQQYYQDNIPAFTKNGKTRPFGEVKGEIAADLKQQKLQQIFSDKSQKLSDLTYTTPNSLEPAAQALGLKIQTTEYFTRDSKKTGVAANPQVIAAAFTDDVVKNSNNSNVIQLKEGDVIVLRMKNYQPAAVRPLAEVKTQIEQALRQQAAQKQAQALGNKIIAELQAGKSLTTLSQQSRLNWQYKNNVTRQTSGINPQILQAAFNLVRPKNATPSVSGLPLADGDFALVTVKNVYEGAVPTSKQSLNVIEGEIENNFGQLEYQLYINNLMQHAKIKMLTINND